MNYDALVRDALTRVREVMPWEVQRRLESGETLLLLDVREPAEFAALHIPGSINVPRGILEQSCEWDYDETVPELAGGRERAIVVICRSGKRSALAADTLQRMGFSRVVSLRTGIRGWNDNEQPLQDASGQTLDPDMVEVMLTSHPRPEQRARRG
ncbi:MAG: rhodanese-like domain-containing protein [Sideroxydans sp.]